MPKRRIGKNCRHRSGWYASGSLRQKAHFFDNDVPLSVCGRADWKRFCVPWLRARGLRYEECKTCQRMVGAGQR